MCLYYTILIIILIYVVFKYNKMYYFNCALIVVGAFLGTLIALQFDDDRLSGKDLLIITPICKWIGYILFSMSVLLAIIL